MQDAAIFEEYGGRKVVNLFQDICLLPLTREVCDGRDVFNFSLSDGFEHNAIVALEKEPMPFFPVFLNES